MCDEQGKYWKKIKTNIKLLYLGELTEERGKISKRYSHYSFCNNFIADMNNYEEEDNFCICGHQIYQNYKYTHKDRPEDYFILGSCCIKLFSEDYKQKRSCLDCNIKIKLNQTNRCKSCRKNYKKCKKCSEQHSRNKKYCKECCKEIDSKYKYCFKCNERNKQIYKYLYS